MYIVILNSDSESVDCLDLSNKPFNVDLFEFVVKMEFQYLKDSYAEILHLYCF